MAAGIKLHIQKHTLNLYEGEYDRLGDFFPRIGAGPAIREMVHDYIKQLEARQKTKIENINVGEIK